MNVENSAGKAEILTFLEKEVGRIGLEPMTPTLSKQRSEPTELTSPSAKFKQFSTFILLALQTFLHLLYQL